MALDFNYQDFDYIEIQDTVKLDWNKIWTNRGHTIGDGLVSPDHKHFYLNIPKNSSSSIKSALSGLGWEYASLSDYPDAKIIVVLRDPIKRWISAVTEYLMMYHQNVIDNIVEPRNYGFLPLLGQKLGLSLIFDKLTFDDHTERQAVFLRDIPLDECIWVMLDNNFNQTFSQLLADIGYPNTFNQAKKENSSDDIEFIKKKELTDFITLAIDKDEFRQYNVKQWYWCDYKLINRVKFYESR